MNIQGLGARSAALVVALSIGAAAVTQTASAAPERTAVGGESKRRVVDDVRIAPSDFTNPTRVTNRYAPISEITHVVMLGVDEGKPLRVETKLLSETKTIAWEAGSTEVLVSQYLAFVEDEVVEVAYDWFAQDDAGNVWYFGEEVTNFEKGKVANHEGSWIAGVDGPPGMLMPAEPRVGDVFHPENIPGLVYEEDRVISTTKRINGPSGPIEGVVKVRETLMDGVVEQKYWAPGYGEFRAVTPGVEDVRIVFTLPADAQAVPVPVELTNVRRLAAEAFGLAAAGDERALAERVAAIRADWTTYVSEDRSAVPAKFIDATQAAVDELVQATNAGKSTVTKQAAVALELAILDVITTYGQVEDGLRLDALRRRLEQETAAGTRTAIDNTTTVIELLRQRASL